MADRIKGLTIVIDGNTTKLSKSLEGVNKDIRETQNQLKDVESLLRMNPGNIELLKQKEELLNKALDDTKQKLEKLKDAQAQMDASGVDKNTSQYQSLQREIIATEGSLKKLQVQAAASNSSLITLSQAARQVADGAQGIADSTAKMSSVAAKGLSSIIDLGIAAGKDADELLTLSKQTGLSTDALQKMSYASNLIDVDVSTITSSITKMRNNLINNEAIFEAIGVAVKDANGEYRTTEEIFNDVVVALGNIDNETERDTRAMQIFGNNADQLAGILDDGGAALKALGEEAENKGLIISEEDVAKAGEFNDQIDKLKAQLKGSFGQAAVRVAEAITPLLDKIATIIEKLSEKIANVSPQTVEIVATVLAIIAAISPVASIIAKIATTISALTPVIAAINAVIAANPIVLIIMGIIAAITLLVIAIKEIIKNWDNIKEGATMVWEAVSGAFTKIKDSVVGAFENVKTSVTGALDNIKTSASEKFGAVKEAASTALNTAKEVAVEKLAAMKKAFDENGGGIKGTMAAAWEGIKGAYTAGFSFIDKLTGGKLGEIKDAIFGKFGEIIDKAKTWGKDMIQNLIDGILGMIDKVKETVGKVANTIKDFLGFSEPDEGPLKNFHTFMPDMIDLMTKGIDDNLYKVQDSMNELATTLVPQTNVNVNYNDSAVTSRLDNIGESLNRDTAPVPVTVVLQGDAQGIFKLVQSQNVVYKKSTGQSAFA